MFHNNIPIYKQLITESSRCPISLIPGLSRGTEVGQVHEYRQRRGGGWQEPGESDRGRPAGGEWG